MRVMLCVAIIVKARMSRRDAFISTKLDRLILAGYEWKLRDVIRTEIFTKPKHQNK